MTDNGANAKLHEQCVYRVKVVDIISSNFLRVRVSLPFRITYEQQVSLVGVARPSADDQHRTLPELKRLFHFRRYFARISVIHDTPGHYQAELWDGDGASVNRRIVELGLGESDGTDIPACPIAP